MARPGFKPTTSRSRSGCSTTEPAVPFGKAVMLRIFFEHCSDIWITEGLTDAGSFVYNKLTYEPLA